MKAKEYCDYYHSLIANGEDEKKALMMLVRAMLEEADELMKERHCQGLSAGISVLNEMNDRWNAMRKYDPGFKRNGFMALIDTTPIKFMKEKSK